MEEKERYEFIDFEDRIELIDTKNKKALDNADNIKDTLNEQDKQIADLEAKLAESEKKYAELFCRNIELETLYSQKTARLNFYKDTDIVEENQQLKQQLAEKDKEIERLKIYDEYRFELPYPKVKILGKTFEDIQELIDKWLKQGSKDKISFAVEQLDKVKEKILSYENIYYQFLESGAKVPVVCLENFRVKQTIDNQIKELKGEE